MGLIYTEDLAFIQAAAFGGLARGAAPEVLQWLNSAAIHIRKVLDVGNCAGRRPKGAIYTQLDL